MIERWFETRWSQLVQPRPEFDHNNKPRLWLKMYHARREIDTKHEITRKYSSHWRGAMFELSD